jgi:hypothetical protein
MFWRIWDYSAVAERRRSPWSQRRLRQATSSLVLSPIADVKSEAGVMYQKIRLGVFDMMH